jgi:hypothetical protein
MELDACERGAVKRAAKLADLAAEVEADLAQRGLWVVGSTGQDMLNAEVGRPATLHASIASTLAPVSRSRSLRRKNRTLDLDAASCRC